MVRRYLLVWGVIAIVVLIAFGIVEALNVPLLVDPSTQLERGGFAAAALGVGLLWIADFGAFEMEGRSGGVEVVADASSGKLVCVDTLPVFPAE